MQTYNLGSTFNVSATQSDIRNYFLTMSYHLNTTYKNLWPLVSMFNLQEVYNLRAEKSVTSATLCSALSGIRISLKLAISLLALFVFIQIDR